MKGYALIRRILVELDRRFRLSGGIFYLTPEELPELEGGADLSERIAGRRRRRLVALSLEVPQVLFSDDLEAIGRPAPVVGGETLLGVPLSAGVAEGPALVLHQPQDAAVPPEPYILVCPSTDPAWVPLFVNARGLVMETGGVLSHGAIVAREFGLPAVAGLPDVLHKVRSGQRLRVDGAAGTVTLLAP
jgi:pyruvate,water dikinase